MTVADVFAALAGHRARLEGRSLRRLFDEDADRFGRFSVQCGDILLDYSKNRIDAPAMTALLDLASAADVAGQREAMFRGEAINNTEGRAVLHVALRAAASDSFRCNGSDVVPMVQATLDRALAFAQGIRDGSIAGQGGVRFTDVVNIGIGGSDLGPALVARALSPYRGGPRAHFVSNVDGAHIADTLAGLHPSRTLIVIVSKTFTTVETMTNAKLARDWVVRRLGQGAVPRHFAAVSTALDKVAAFGIEAERIFGFWDWVGGRYSVWSAVGLSVMAAIGPDHFRQFLAGARAMDEHFRTAAPEANLPIILALIGIWNRNVWGYPALAVLPYDQRLERLPAYLQQLDMESNGKGVTRAGGRVARPTGPLVFGEPGTNGQHAFYQFLHQGPDVVPADFLVAALGHEADVGSHAILLANCLAQSQALMRGRTPEEARQALEASGLSPERAVALAPHKTFPGDRPSNTILYRKLDPFTLGAILALYEHKVFVQGAIWGVNSFDQWGVELGKEYATNLLAAVKGEALPAGDASTRGLLAAIAGLRRGPG
ncbi:MAG: glucose-6-phosphate isomerase [Bauldia sp.]